MSKIVNGGDEEIGIVYRRSNVSQGMRQNRLGFFREYVVLCGGKVECGVQVIKDKVREGGGD